MLAYAAVRRIRFRLALQSAMGASDASPGASRFRLNPRERGLPSPGETELTTAPRGRADRVWYLTATSVVSGGRAAVAGALGAFDEGPNQVDRGGEDNRRSLGAAELEERLQVAQL